ncbi:MAG TPA: hypothetical protein VFU22_22815 [Roseiflexaceae bacterium]|nr:hypothetical protein [Roseiflexaceae bacterium]
MLWLIWIAIMLLTPVLAGVGVWLQLQAQPREAVMAEASNEQEPGRSP